MRHILWDDGPKHVKLVDSATGEYILTVRRWAYDWPYFWRAEKITAEVRGFHTVWHWYPSGTRCSAGDRSDLFFWWAKETLRRTFAELERAFAELRCENVELKREDAEKAEKEDK